MNPFEFTTNEFSVIQKIEEPGVSYRTATPMDLFPLLFVLVTVRIPGCISDK